MIDPGDTRPDAERVYFELLRGLSASARMDRLGGIIALGHTLSMMGIRQRHPELDEIQLEAEYVRLMLGPELAERVFEARRRRDDPSRDSRDRAEPV